MIQEMSYKCFDITENFQRGSMKDNAKQNYFRCNASPEFCQHLKALVCRSKSLIEESVFPISLL